MSDMITVPLYRAAHGRTGDKGNRSNISVIAWHPELWDLLVDQVTPEAVAAQFEHRRPTKVTRHLLPRLHAMNFVLDDVLDGDVLSSAAADAVEREHAILERTHHARRSVRQPGSFYRVLLADRPE